MRILDDRERKVSYGWTVPDVIRHGREYGAGAGGGVGSGEGDREEEAMGDAGCSGSGGMSDLRK